jgi:hypothetical protein
LLLTEALFAPLLVATWWLVLTVIDHRRPLPLANAIILGLGLTGCIMLRPSCTILVAIVPVLVVAYRRFAPAAWISAGVMVIAVVVGLFPWAARNANVLGEWRWTTTRGGISLYDGLQPRATGASDLAHTKTDPTAIGLSEVAWDRYWHDQAMPALRQEPGRVIALAGRKFLRTWNIVPNEAEHRRGIAAVIGAVWSVGILATAAVGWWQVRRAARWWLALLMPVFAFTALHMVFIGSVRYRIPVMPMLFVVSAMGMWFMIDRVRPATGRANTSGLMAEGSSR